MKQREHNNMWCEEYGDKVIRDERGNCSLCGASDSNFTGLARDLYYHASINPRGPGVAGTVNGAGTTSSGAGTAPRTIESKLAI